MSEKYSYYEINKKISDIYPNWIDHVNTKKFTDWIDGQDNEVKKLASSNNIKDALNCLQMYYTYFNLIKFH